MHKTQVFLKLFFPSSVIESNESDVTISSSRSLLFFKKNSLQFVQFFLKSIYASYTSKNIKPTTKNCLSFIHLYDHFCKYVITQLDSEFIFTPNLSFINERGTPFITIISYTLNCLKLMTDFSTCNKFAGYCSNLKFHTITFYEFILQHKGRSQEK